MMQVKLIIEDEALLMDNLAITNELSWKDMKCKYPVLRKFSFVEYPGLPGAYKYLVGVLKNKEDEKKQIPAKLVVHLYNTYGLERAVVQEIASDIGTYSHLNHVLSPSCKITVRAVLQVIRLIGTLWIVLSMKRKIARGNR